jgi:hypothetical protein
MLNLTLISLSLHSYDPSPFISQSTLHARLTWHFHSLRATQFFSSFSHNLFNSHYIRCSFTHFLSSAVSITTKTYRNQHTELTLFGHLDSFVEILDSEFSSENFLAGGAVNILKSGSTLSISRTTFRRCVAGYRGGAISFFGQHFILDSVCFVSCESADSAMALESHLDPENSTLRITNTQILRCSDEESLQEFRFASIYLILGTQFARYLNSTSNDASHGGSFGATEDSFAFDFQYIVVCNDTGRSVFEFEDLTPNAIFAYVNVIQCRQSTMWGSETGSCLFSLAGSVLTLKYASIFQVNVNFIVRNGDLTFERVGTDFAENPPTLSGSFNAMNCKFQQEIVKTVKLKGFKNTECLLTELTPGMTPTASELEFQFESEENTGIITFLVIAGIAGVLLFVYYAFIKKNNEYERLGELVPLPFEK